MSVLAKRTKISVVIVALLLLTAGAFWLFRGRGGVSGPESGEGRPPEELARLAESEQPSSADLIDRALAEGAIDAPTAAVYTMYAAFGDPRLPEAYASDAPMLGVNNRLLGIRLAFETYPQEAKDAIAPFLKRPDDPESYVNLRTTESPEEETGWLVPAAHAARPGGVYTESLLSADGKIKIWYPKTNTNSKNVFGTGNVAINAATAKAMAQRIKGFLDGDKIIASFEGLLHRQLLSDGTKGGDGKFDIYVAPAGSDLGLTFPEQGTPTPSYIIINTSIGLSKDDILKTTLAHELFHAFQYVYAYDTTRDNWYSEATAEWSEDYIYRTANTEQPWLKKFMPFPEVGLTVEKPPEGHMYGAYIFPFFLTGRFGNDLMRTSWEACERTSCIEGLDGLIDGGLKTQWREFTLWNDNRGPARFYVDYGTFPAHSSEEGKDVETVFYGGGEQTVDVDALKPLSADLSIVENMADEQKVHRVDFSDLQTFAGKTDRASIKAIIYYRDGRTAIEDWTKRQSRSFCFENKNERFEKIVLIFGNAEMKRDIGASGITIEEKPSCYLIDQSDQRTATLHLPYLDQGVAKTATIPAEANVDSLGDITAPAREGTAYGYETTWKVRHEYELIRNAFRFECGGGEIDVDPGWTTRTAGYLTFNLDPETLNDDGTFSVDLEYGVPHPRGNVENVPPMSVQCIGVAAAAASIDTSGITGVMKGVYRGKIVEETPDGAKLEILNSCIYGSCTMADGSPFQDMDPITLSIKRSD